MASLVGITERAVQGIVSDLVDEGYVSKTRVGRRNHYKINPRRRLRHPLAEHQRIGELLGVLTTD